MSRLNEPDLKTAFDLTGQSALITGGATGLGFGMASRLVAAGTKVVLVGRRKAELRRACAELGPNAFPLQGDVTKLDSAASLVERGEPLAGPLSLLINNAGVHLKKSAMETADSDFASVLQTPVFGAFALTREAGRRMVERKSGCILFTASMTSFFGEPHDTGWAGVCLASPAAKFINGVVLPVDGGAAIGF